jgi:RHS repeat-associated protein
VNPIRFSTQYADDWTGDLKYLHRDYRPDLGRWPNRDPIEDQYVRWGVDQMNHRFGRQTQKREPSPYAFVINNPISYVDPDGRALCSAGGLATTWGIALAEPTPVGEVVALGITVTVAVAACAEGISYCWCSKRHPTWMKCRKDAFNDPIKALVRDAVPVPGWTGPLLAGVHPRGVAHSCPGGAPGTRFGMEVNYIRHTEAGIIRWEMEIPVNCCACCNTFTSGVSCEVVHRGIGSGGQTLPPPVP